MPAHSTASDEMCVKAQKHQSAAAWTEQGVMGTALQACHSAWGLHHLYGGGLPGHCNRPSWQCTSCCILLHAAVCSRCHMRVHEMTAFASISYQH
jgi:hypothetical protein